MKQQPLAGLRVVDFTWAAAGPMATLYLALHGAEVIKIESTHSIDMARRGYYTPVADIDGSPNFHDVNLGKLSVRLNLKQPKARDLAKAIVAMSDVVVENFRPGVMERNGLDYESLKLVKPDIIMLSSSTGGQTGPDKDLPGYATTFAALGGLSYVTGHGGGPPAEIWESVDIRLGTASALAVSMALYRQRRTGEGQFIDLSSQEQVSTMIGHSFIGFQMNGRLTERRGNRDDIMAPHGCYPCLGDGRWISIAVATDEEWQALCRVANKPDWGSDERFADTYGRFLHQEEIELLIGPWTAKQLAWDLAHRLQEAGVAAVPSLDTEELVNDPHLKARGFFLDVVHPKLGMTHPVRPPWKLSDMTPVDPRPGPMIGGDAEHVFRDLLGLGSEQMNNLQSDGVFE